MDFDSYITGFTDWEWCFSISFTLRSKLKTWIEVRPSFSISQNKRNFTILEKINDYFGCWSMRFSKNDQNYKYEVRNLSDICDKIIPHFEKNKLLTTKSKDFELFSKVCKMMKKSQHLNSSYLEEIIKYSYEMNESWKRKHKRQKLLSILDKMKI